MDDDDDDRSNRLFPKTREELKKCIKVGTCLFRKKKTETHVRINDVSFNLSSSFPIIG